MRDPEFERLYDEHAARLLSFLSYRTGDRALAEDLLADTFERALRARGRFDRRKGREKTWLYSIAVNLLRDHLRRQGAEERAVEGAAARDPGPAERSELDRLEDRDRVNRALGALSEEEREAIALRFGADLTVPEIARVTHERLTTVEGRVYRSLRKLRDELSG